MPWRSDPEIWHSGAEDVEVDDLFAILVEVDGTNVERLVDIPDQMSQDPQRRFPIEHCWTLIRTALRARH